MASFKNDAHSSLSLMIATTFFVSLFFSATTKAQQGSPQSAEQLVQSIKRFERDAEKIDTAEIYKALIFSIDQRSLAAEKKGIDFGVLNDEVFQRDVAYITVLKKRRIANEPDAAFYYGTYKLRECGGLVIAVGESKNSSVVTDCYREAIESFKIASNANIAPASYNVGVIYKEGRGMGASKYVAADWFIKAANQYLKANERDKALASMEMALNLVPDHPVALKLRTEMLK